MSLPLSADRTAESLLWYYEEPRRYRAEGRRRDAPLLDSGVVLKLALGRRVDFDRAALTDAHTVVMLRDAAALYVRFVFFRPEATPYQILGLAQGASPESIKESFRLLMHLVHPDRQDARVVWPDSFAALANRAYGILRNQDTRVQFDREAQARAAMARSINRTAADSAASKMPVPLRPRPRFGKRGALVRALPEWLTAGVGGFVREHPSATAFSALIAVAMLWVGMMVWERQEEVWVRDVDGALEHTAASLPRLPKLAWFGAPAESPTKSAPTPTGNAKRSPPADTKASGASEAKASSVHPTPVPSPVQGRATASAAQPSAQVAVSESASEIVTREPPPAIASEPPQVLSPVLSPPRQVASVEPSPATPAASASMSATVVALPVVATTAPVQSVATPAAVTVARVDPPATALVPAAAPSPPATTEIESLFAMFVESYERGRLDAFTDLFDIEAETNLRHGRTAIRSEYDELFRLSQWRKMQLTRINWKRVGNRTVAKGEVTVRIGWRDGREVEQRLAMDMELMRRDGRVVIARLSQQPRN